MTTNMTYSAFFRTFTDMHIHTLLVLTHYDDIMKLEHTSLFDTTAIPRRNSQRNQGTARKIL